MTTATTKNSCQFVFRTATFFRGHFFVFWRQTQFFFTTTARRTSTDLNQWGVDIDHRLTTTAAAFERLNTTGHRVITRHCVEIAESIGRSQFFLNRRNEIFCLINCGVVKVFLLQTSDQIIQLTRKIVRFFDFRSLIFQISQSRC